MTAEQKNFEAKVNQLVKLGAYQYTGGETAIAFMKKCMSVQFSVYDMLIGLCENAVPFFTSLGEKWIYVVNAFFCGLWNSLLEAILGIIDLVAYLFKALGMAGDAMANAQTFIPETLELIDETIQSISTIDFGTIFSEAVSEIIKQLSGLDLSAWLSSAVSLEKVAYFLGSLAGFVVQILVSIFYSGGLDGVRAALTKLGAVGTGVVDFFKAAIEKAIGIAAGFSLEGMMKIGQQIIKTLKAGAKAVVEFIKYI